MPDDDERSASRPDPPERSNASDDHETTFEMSPESANTSADGTPSPHERTPAQSDQDLTPVNDGAGKMTWKITVVATVGATLLTSAIQLVAREGWEWWDERDPLVVTVQVPMPEPYALVVTDESRLPERSTITSTSGCEAAWQAGLQAGGVQSEKAVYGVSLEGKVAGGVTVLALEARVTRRSAALEGVVIPCGPAGSISSSEMTFDLSSGGDTAPVRITGDSGQPVRTGGALFKIADGEALSWTLTTVTPPTDSLEWVVDAKLLVDGKRRDFVIDNEGSAFRGTGQGTDMESFLERIWGSGNP